MEKQNDPSHRQAEVSYSRKLMGENIHESRLPLSCRNIFVEFNFTKTATSCYHVVKERRNTLLANKSKWQNRRKFSPGENSGYTLLVLYRYQLQPSVFIWPHYFLACWSCPMCSTSKKVVVPNLYRLLTVV